VTPLSDDPAKRERQLANLRPVTENLVPGAGAWKPGDAPHLVHGARGRQSWSSADWSPAVELAITELERCVGVELKGEDGELEPWARPSIEAVAQQRVNMRRGERLAEDRAARGRLSMEDVERQSKVVDAYHRALEREALTLRSRIDTSEQLAKLMGSADLRRLPDEELDALIADLGEERKVRPSSLSPPDARERSRRAAALLSEAGTFNGDRDDVSDASQSPMVDLDGVEVEAEDAEMPLDPTDPGVRRAR
jgi:hypothetical protein